MKLFKFLCRMGWHIPIILLRHNFIDIISGKRVNDYKCACGKTWMANSKLAGVFFKVKKDEPPACLHGVCKPAKYSFLPSPKYPYQFMGFTCHKDGAICNKCGAKIIGIIPMVEHNSECQRINFIDEQKADT